MINASRSIKACAEYYGDSASAMESYLLDGEQKALELGNRVPIKFDEHGNLCPKIRKAKYKDEKSYLYKPFQDSQKTYVWDNQARKDLKDYNLEDLSI